MQECLFYTPPMFGGNSQKFVAIYCHHDKSIPSLSSKYFDEGYCIGTNHATHWASLKDPT